MLTLCRRFAQLFHALVARTRNIWKTTPTRKGYYTVTTVGNSVTPWGLTRIPERGRKDS